MEQREAETALIAELRPLLRKERFNRKGTSWYRYDSQFLQMMEIQVGQRAVVAKLGAMYRPLNHVTYPAIDACHLSIGMGGIVPPEVDWRSARAYPQWPTVSDDPIRALVEVFQRFGLPVLDRWRCESSVREFLKSPLVARTTLHRDFLERFG